MARCGGPGWLLGPMPHGGALGTMTASQIRQRTMHPALPVITVLGASGAQGGGLVRALLCPAQVRFAVRAVTRKPASPAAQALAEAGAEVVAGDLDDPHTLRRAIEGAHGLFAVTNFWEHLSPERELLQARNIADAARDAAVRHVIWSTLEDTRRWVPLEDARLPTLMGNYKVPHFDAKGAADALFRVRGLPLTRLITSFHWDNLIHFGMGPRRGLDGRLVLALPMGEMPLPGIAAADIGPCAAALFARGETVIGQCVGIAGGHLTMAQMAEVLSGVMGEAVRPVSPRFADYAALPFPGAADLANMFQFKHDFNAEFCARRDVAATRELHPRLQDFATWAQRHAHGLRAGAGLA